MNLLIDLIYHYHQGGWFTCFSLNLLVCWHLISFKKWRNHEVMKEEAVKKISRIVTRIEDAYFVFYFSLSDCLLLECLFDGTLKHFTNLDFFINCRNVIWGLMFDLYVVMHDSLLFPRSFLDWYLWSLFWLEYFSARPKSWLVHIS